MTPPVRYYEKHEAEYQRRLAQGHVGWDAGDYDDFFMRPFIERCLGRFSVAETRPTALDLGCGTGALSCQLAEAGFEVTGIDISPSAIDFARRIVADRGLAIDFMLADVCADSLGRRRFDVIVDGHLLHCIVFERERHELLIRLRRALRPGGQFWIETMLSSPEMTIDVDERGVVWSPVQDASSCREAVFREGRWWMPQRLIALSEAAVIQELEDAGFRIVESEQYGPLEAGAPGGLRIRCGVPGEA
ncbi:MAG: class I SAM-dependent methyltransferase [Planctomycetota bacterium]